MINGNFISEVENLQQTYHKTYKINPSLFTSAYNNESQMSQDYNGRQILELLQNADDAKAPFVKITLNKTNKTLSFANTGDNPFTSKGIESLMLANNSPKDPNENIGNKGLGFRAVIAWCNEITIFSNKTKIEFSKEIIKSYVCTSDEKLCLNYSMDDIEKLNKEKKIKPKNIIPFPILGMPKLTKSDITTNWTTEIILKYKNDGKIEKSIEEQLSLDDTILLFLKSVSDIEIEIKEDNAQTIKKRIHKEVLPQTEIKYDNDIIFQKILLGNEEWNLLSRFGLFPKEYQVTEEEDELDSFSSIIAWQDDLNKENSYPLCCYFPTQIKINLPFIIHGNFEVNAARNLLVSEVTSISKNDFLFSSILMLIDKAIEIEQKKSKISNWNSYKILHTTTDNTNGLKLLIDGLNNRINTLAIYPSISKNLYLSKDEYIFYSDEISNFFEKKYTTEFVQMIKSPKELYIEKKIYDPEVFIEKINNINYERSTEISDRGDLIKYLYNFTVNNKYIDWAGDNKLNLLINQNFEPIGKEKTAYINSENPNIDYKVAKPNFVKFELTHQELNNQLYKKLNVASFISNKSNDNNPKRKLCEMIESFIKVDDFDITQITKQIISKTNELKKKEPENEFFYITEMTKSLFKNFKERRNDWGNPDYSNICFLNKNKHVKEASELYFSESYNTNNVGKRVEYIFEDINSDDDYLLPFDEWNIFEKDDMDIVCNFFAYFGVNEFVTVKNDEIKKDVLDAYIDHCKTEIYSRYPSNYRIVKEPKYTTYLAIQNLDKIKKIHNITKIILAIFWSRMSFGDRGTELVNKLKINTDSFLLHYGQDYPHVQVMSYVAYQLISTGLFYEYFLDETESSIYKLINKTNILDFKILQNNNINKKDVYEVLSKLECKKTLSEYEPSYIYTLLRNLEYLDEYKNGTGIQSIYFEAKQALVEIAKNGNKTIEIPNDIKYYAFKNGIGTFVPKDLVYYFDNNTMPKVFLDEHYILNMKKRAGEEAFHKYFGTKNKEDIKIVLSNLQEDNCPNSEFTQLLKRLKPYILAYRFAYAKLDEENKNQNAKVLETLTIKLISYGEYKLDEMESKAFKNYEFFYNENNQNYYLKVPENIDLFDLTKKSEFQNSFSEIVCSAFKLRDNILVKDLRLLISYDENELKNRITEDREISLSDIEDCKQRLNIKDSPFYLFWKYLFHLTKKDVVLPESTDELKHFLKENLNLSNNIFEYTDYLNFNSSQGISFLKNIKQLFNVDIKILLINLNQNLREYNLNQLEQKLDFLKPKYVSLLWNYCLNENKQNIYIEQRIKFDKLIEDFNLDIELDYGIELDYNTKVLSKIMSLPPSFDLNCDIPIENHEELPEYKDFSECVQNTDKKYLLYFPGNIEELKALYFKYKQKIADENKQLEEDLSDYENLNITASIVTSKRPPTEIPIPSGKRNTGKNETPHVVDENDNRKKKISGIKAEKIVKAYFIQNKIQYEQKSGMSKDAIGNDNNHYDFYYYNNDDKKIYVEVKSTEDNSFYMTEAERKFAEKNYSRYEIALVNIKTKSILFVKDVFSYIQEDRSFKDNDRFIAIPTQYYVKLNI